MRRCLVESLTFEGGWSEHFLRVLGSIDQEVAVDASEGIKFITYSKWFRPATDNKKHTFAYHLLRPKDIRTVAAFRMSAHKLCIETGRHTNIARDARPCRCCEAACVEDELHVFECAKYHGLRSLYGYETAHCDATFRAQMNPSDSAEDWKKLAAYLCDVFTMRESAV